MNPVVGLDISKGESQVQAFLDKSQLYRKSFSVKHTLDDLGGLLEFLKEVERLADGKQPSVILEQVSTICLSFNFWRSNSISILL